MNSSRKFLIFSLMFFVFNFCAMNHFTVSAPTDYQILPTQEGYVPVYIRVGDTPLSDINLELAAAFHEDNQNEMVEKPADVQNDAPNLKVEKENVEKSSNEKDTPLIDETQSHLGELENENDSGKERKSRSPHHEPGHEGHDHSTSLDEEIDKVFGDKNDEKDDSNNMEKVDENKKTEN